MIVRMIARLVGALFDQAGWLFKRKKSISGSDKIS
jgi:hypothetical protein